MNNDKLKSGSVVELILETMADELIKMGGYYQPRLNVIVGYLIKKVLKRRKIQTKKIQRAMKVLEEKEIIFLEKKDNDVFVQLLEKGQSQVLKYSIKSLLDFKKTRKTWQKKWYLVFFDIPEIQRNKRDYLNGFF